MIALDKLKDFTKAMSGCEWVAVRAAKSGKSEDFWLSATDAEAIAVVGPSVMSIGLKEATLVEAIGLTIAQALDLGQVATVAGLATARHDARVAYARVLASEYHAGAIAEARAEAAAEMTAAAEVAA